MRFICFVLFFFLVCIQSEAQVKKSSPPVDQDSLLYYFGVYSASMAQNALEGIIETVCLYEVADKQVYYNSFLETLKKQEFTERNFAEQKFLQAVNFLSMYVNQKKQEYRMAMMDSIIHLSGTAKTKDGYYYRIASKGATPIELTPQTEIQVLDERCNNGEWISQQGLTLPADRQYDNEVLDVIAKNGIGGEIYVWSVSPEGEIDWSKLSIMDISVSDDVPEVVAIAEDVKQEDTPVAMDLETLSPCSYDRDSILSEGYVSILQAISTASSFYADQNLPQYATDQKLETVWVPRNDEESLNQSLYSAVMPYNYQQVYDFDIYNGHVTDLNKWKEYSRIKELALYINKKFISVLSLEDTREVQHFQLPSSIAQTYDQNDLNSVEYRFEIRSLYPGVKYKEPALSEIVFMATNFACIAKGTLVNLYAGGKYAGSKTIEQVVAGDIVQQLSADRKSYLPASVVKVDRVLHDNIVDLCMDNESHLLLTDDHPVYVNNKGWCSANPQRSRRSYSHYAEVQLLRVGDEVQTTLESGQTTNRVVRSITSVPQQTETYSLTLESGDNFVAGSIAVAVLAK